MKTSLRTLVYKRTHRGDPDDSGVFGVNDCMGGVRGWDFDAVIGVGGSHPDRGHECIARKVNWVGIGPHEVGATARGPCLGFDFFCRFDEAGPLLEARAPELFGYMFEEKHVRVLLSQNHPQKIQADVQSLLTWAVTNKCLSKPQPLPEVKRGYRARCGC